MTLVIAQTALHTSKLTNDNPRKQSIVQCSYLTTMHCCIVYTYGYYPLCSQQNVFYVNFFRRNNQIELRGLYICIAYARLAFFYVFFRLVAPIFDLIHTRYMFVVVSAAAATAFKLKWTYWTHWVSERMLAIASRT